MEYIEDTQISPLISHVKIKVCWVGQEANRNHTVITKDVATEMGKKLSGSPIVGYFNSKENDYEQHNRDIQIDESGINIIDTTKPYGFVPTDAKVWFQWFEDDGVSHEYLCTEGYLWTTAYPESNRVISKGNNQSMELNKEGSPGTWTNDNNSGQRIFIYSEALLEKLCILGENYEPCFEGASITSYSLNMQDFEEFKNTMFSMINELKETLEKGGKKVEITTYAVEIGDALWGALYSTLEVKYPNSNENCCGSRFAIRGIFEEGSQKFAILADREEGKLYRANFTYDEEGLNLEEEFTQVVETYVPAENLQFSLEDNDNYKKSNEEDKKEQEDSDENEDNKKGEGSEEKEDEDKEDKKKYNLEEVVEYQELIEKYSSLEAQLNELQEKYNALETEKNSLDSEIVSLRNFKLAGERKEKQEMIDKFYMLDDEAKKDCIDNIDTYSLEEIESKLSVYCFRHEINFKAEEDDQSNQPMLFNLNNQEDADEAPEWVKAVRRIQQNKEEF